MRSAVPPITAARSAAGKPDTKFLDAPPDVRKTAAQQNHRQLLAAITRCAPKFVST